MHQPLRIAVVADTHDRIPPGLPTRLAGADEIWHLGDVCAPETLGIFEALGRPVFAVIGNNEWHQDWPIERRLDRSGRRFLLIHIAPPRAPSGVDFILHGHTHVPRDDTDARGVRWLNPGCITRPNRGAPASFAWLTLRAGEPVEWKLELL